MQVECRKWVWQLSSRDRAVMQLLAVRAYSISGHRKQVSSNKTPTSMKHKCRVDCKPSGV